MSDNKETMFVCIGMNDREYEDIKKEIDEISKQYPQYDIIHNLDAQAPETEYRYNEDKDEYEPIITVDGNIKLENLWYLGKAIQKLSTVDHVYLADGWEKYRGCNIEYQVCLLYNIHIIND